MKRTIILSMAALVSFAACQKENTPAQQETKITVLSATVEQQTGDTKTALGSGNTVVWSENDEVRVWNGDNTNTPFTLTDGAGTTQGKFIGDEITNPKYAFYPSSAVTGVSEAEATFTLPAVQHYVENSFDNGANVAVAQISGNNMAFKNVCGVLKLQLKGTTIVKSITIKGKNDEKLNGTYSVNCNESCPTVLCKTTEVETEKTITLICEDGVRLTPTKAVDFYIVIPNGAFSKGFSVSVTDIYSADEQIIAAKNLINRSIILSMPEKYINIKGTIIPGVFSVSDQQKVLFSSGNLIANIDAEGNPLSWKFSKNQYDVIGSNGANLTIGSVAGDIDFFSWSTDAGKKPWGIFASNSNADCAGEFVDWASNEDLKKSLGSIWRTPSAFEWDYLLKTRSASTVNGIANARYAMIGIDNGTINRLLVLFPDSFTWDTKTMGTAPNYINEGVKTELPYYSLNQINEMEHAGCVFIRYGGVGYSTHIAYSYYWCHVASSSSNGNDKFSAVLGTETKAATSASNRCDRAFVRLVTNL